MFRERINNERGISVVLVALSIIVLFGFGALAIDVAHIYNVKNQLQVAADAAALAGANELQYNFQHGYGYDPSNQDEARQAAFRVALKNMASVAAADIAGCSLPSNCTYPGCKAGNPAPVCLNTAFTGGTGDDIELGHWSGGSSSEGFVPITNTGEYKLINAVKVTAKRTGAKNYQPTVSNWFAKVFRLFGAGFDFTNISATAIAALDKMDIVPIAVNEYWHEDVKPSNNEYGQVYPQSFMRHTNIDGNASTMVGKPFGILGANANSNISSNDTCGYVNILYRDAFHNSTSFYSVVPQGGKATCSSTNCSNNLSYIGTLSTGTIDNTKWDGTGNFGYLFTGIPDNIIPPNAVREYDNNMGRPTPISSDSFGDNTYGPHNNTTNSLIGTRQDNNPQSPTDNCPLATIPYYQISGNPMNQSPSPTYKDLTFNVKYPKGTRFMVMVYDGTHVNNPSSQANTVTVIGYGVIEVDGYANGSGKNVLNNLGDDGNTCYGHAVKHNLTSSDVDTSVIDISDPYLLQTPYTPVGNVPVSSLGNCGFTDQIRTLANKLSYVHLVNPGLRYGVKDH